MIGNLAHRPTPEHVLTAMPAAMAKVTMTTDQVLAALRVRVPQRKRWCSSAGSQSVNRVYAPDLPFVSS